MDAIAAFSRATDSQDPEFAARAALRAAALLRQIGELEEAREEVLRVGARPDIAVHLGPQLAQEGRPEEAVPVFQAAIAADQEPSRGAALRIWLARLLAPTAADEARARYAEAAEMPDPELAAVAISELAAMMREADEGAEAETLLGKRAATDPVVAATLSALEEEQDD